MNSLLPLILMVMGTEPLLFDLRLTYQLDISQHPSNLRCSISPYLIYLLGYPCSTCPCSPLACWQWWLYIIVRGNYGCDRCRWRGRAAGRPKLSMVLVFPSLSFWFLCLWTAGRPRLGKKANCREVRHGISCRGSQVLSLLTFSSRVWNFFSFVALKISSVLLITIFIAIAHLRISDAYVETSNNFLFVCELSRVIQWPLFLNHYWL
jgi:hypothetical protein